MFPPEGGGDTTPEALATALADASNAAAAVAATSPVERRTWLRAVADDLEMHTDMLVAIAEKTTTAGRQALRGEVARVAGQLRFYGEIAAEGSYLDVTVDSATEITPRRVQVNRPLGPVAIFGSGNSPFVSGVLGRDTAAALAAGCPVLAHVHPAHQSLGARLAEIAEEAIAAGGGPPGSFASVSGSDAGVQLVRASAVQAVAFSGSQSDELALRRHVQARERIIPVFADTTTVNPVVVTPAGAATIHQIAAGVVRSFTLDFGQFGTKPCLLFAPAGHEVARSLGAYLASASPGPVMPTLEINESVTRELAELRAAGAVMVQQVAGFESGWTVPAVVLSAPPAAIRSGSRLLEDSSSLPVAIVVEYASVDELRTTLDHLEGAWAASVFTGPGSDPEASRVIETLSSTAARMIAGGWPCGALRSWAQHDDFAWPAPSKSAAILAGAAMLRRFVRPVVYESVPDEYLPMAAQASEIWNVPRRINGRVHPSRRP